MYSKADSLPAKPPARAVSEPPLGPAGGHGPNAFAPKPRYEYKTPSIFWEYRYLLLVVVVAAIAGSLYLIYAPHKQLKIEPPPPPPVYVEPIPARPAASPQ
jgi:hypothetical protein